MKVVDVKETKVIGPGDTVCVCTEGNDGWCLLRLLAFSLGVKIRTLRHLKPKYDFSK